MERPTRFKVSVGGYLGRSFQVELAGPALIYREYGRGFQLVRQTEIMPTDSDWEIFLTKLESLGFWHWRPEYANPGIVDGTSWGVEIELPSRAKLTAGSNSYPGKRRGHRGEMTEEFRAFLDAVSKLVGGMPFF